MKIKGVTGGKSKGNPIEYSPQEKPALAVKDEVPKHAPAGFTWWAEEVMVKNLQHTPRGTGNKGFADNAYVAEGEVRLRQLRISDDAYLPAQNKPFRIQFEDCCDDMGMPDLKVTKFELI